MAEHRTVNATVGGSSPPAPVRFGVQPSQPLVERRTAALYGTGHHADQLTVGLHSIGFVADTTKQAADDFYPGYAQTIAEIGRERGWPPTTRAQVDATRGPTGVLLIGDREKVAEKILYDNEVLAPIVGTELAPALASA